MVTDLELYRTSITLPRGPRDPQVRHLLLTLSTQLSGEGCIQTRVAALAQQTALSRRTVTRLLAKAVQLGWLMPVDAEAEYDFDVWQACVPPLPPR